MSESDLITAAIALLDPARWQVAIDRTNITADTSETSTGGTVRRADLRLDVRGNHHDLVRVEYGLVDVRHVPSGAGGQQCIDPHRELCEVRAYVSPTDALTMIRMAVAHAESQLDEVAVSTAITRMLDVAGAADNALDHHADAFTQLAQEES